MFDVRSNSSLRRCSRSPPQRRRRGRLLLPCVPVAYDSFICVNHGPVYSVPRHRVAGLFSSGPVAATYPYIGHTIGISYDAVPLTNRPGRHVSPPYVRHIVAAAARSARQVNALIPSPLREWLGRRAATSSDFNVGLAAAPPSLPQGEGDRTSSRRGYLRSRGLRRRARARRRSNVEALILPADRAARPDRRCARK